jgi:hypothetical protein
MNGSKELNTLLACADVERREVVKHAAEHCGPRIEPAVVAILIRYCLWDDNSWTENYQGCNRIVGRHCESFFLEARAVNLELYGYFLERAFWCDKI